MVGVCMNYTAASLTAIDEITVESAEVNAVIAARTEPLVLRGAVQHWPAVQAGEHTAGYLQDLATGEPTVFYRAPLSSGGRVGFNPSFTNFNFTREQATLAEIIRLVLKAGCQSEPEHIYLGSTMVDHWLPDFKRDNTINLHAAQPIVSLWLGNQSLVPAHFDCPHNLAACIAGRRRFLLFPPEQVENLYVGPVDLSPSGRPISLVDFNAPDFDRFPRAELALNHAQVAELAPGDAIYIPPLWWHQVTGLESFNALVNYWWVDWRGTGCSPELAFDQALLTLKHLPSEEKRAWKALFDFYIFDDDLQEHIPANLHGVLDNNNKPAAQRWLQRIKERVARAKI